MPKTVLIILAAVVALIVIVVLTGMRYLRAEDEDDFDDDVPAEHGNSRGRGGQQGRDQQMRSRARRDQDLPAERRREAPGGDRRPDRRDPVRAGQDRGWREDSGAMARGGRASLPQREHRPVRPGMRDHEDFGEPAAAAARPGRSQPGRGAIRGRDDYDSMPGRTASSARDYGREATSARERRSGRDLGIDQDDDSFAGRRESRESRDRRDGRDSRDLRESRDATPRRAHGMREDSERDERDRRSTTRPNARPEARKNGAQPKRDELLPAVKPRPGKNKRDSEGDWPSNEWDELSDVDYWAELASDRPLTTADSAGPAPRPQRRESRQETRPGSARGERQDAGGGSDAVTKQVSRPVRQADPDLLPAVARKPSLAELAVPDRAAARSKDARPPIADDDPLTSPSFPRIAADDSRSYRRRSAVGETRQASGREADTRQPALAADEAPAYPAVPPVDPVRGLNGMSQPHTYPLPSGGSGYAAESTGYPAPGADYAAQDYPRSADPYGALPGYQRPTAASYPGSDSVTASYSIPAGSGGYPAGGEAFPAESESSYQASAAYSAPGGTGANGYPAPGGPSAAGYLPPVTSDGGPASLGGGYSGETVVRGTYPGAASGGYPSDAGSGSYQSSPLSSAGYQPEPGASSYQATSGYSFPAGAPGYGSGERADHPADYQGYPGQGRASGSHSRPDLGYPAGSYSSSGESSLPGPLPGQADPGYPVYPAPVPAAHGGAYQEPAPQLPGYPDAAQQAGGYDPPGYPAPAGQNGGYAGADPYAVDPYGYSGYGGRGY